MHLPGYISHSAKLGVAKLNRKVGESNEAVVGFLGRVDCYKIYKEASGMEFELQRGDLGNL